jgi:hypothetical protein
MDWLLEWVLSVLSVAGARGNARIEPRIISAMPIFQEESLNTGPTLA